MQNLKKLLALLLALVMVFSMMTVLSACDDQGGNSESDDEDEEKEKFEPQVVYDDNDVKVTFKGTKKTQYGETLLRFQAENTGEEIIGLEFSHVNVNGYVIDSYGSAHLEPGDKQNPEISLYSEGLKLCNIKNIHTICFNMRIYDPEDYSNGTLETVNIEISENEQEYDDSGMELLNSDGLKVVLKEYDVENENLRMVYYIENNTGMEITTSLDNLQLNGCLPCYTNSFYTTLRDGERYVYASYTNYLDLLDISKKGDLQNIAGTISAYDYENYTNIVDEEFFLAPGDADFRFQPTGGTVMYAQDDLTLKFYDMTDSDPYTNIFVLAEYEGEYPKEFDLRVTEVNGEEYASYSPSVYLEENWMQLLLVDCYREGNAPFDSMKDIDTLTFTLSYYDSNYDYVEESFTYELD